MVKTVVIIGLCFILGFEALFPYVNLTELSHLPELWCHFQKHRIESPKLTFSEFLSLHYDDPEHLATTPKDHKDLPFSKTHRRAPTLQMTHELLLINPETTYIVLTKIESVTDCVVPTSSVTSQIWQPPRA